MTTSRINPVPSDPRCQDWHEEDGHEGVRMNLGGLALRVVEPRGDDGYFDAKRPAMRSKGYTPWPLSRRRP
jgi:hypothetical protein